MNNYSEIPTGLTDCISRQAVIDSLYDWSNHSMTDAETWHLRQVIGDIKSMPSVTPQEPFINKPCVSSGVCEHDKNVVLDKIRAEIVHYQSDYDVHGTEYDRTAWKSFNRCLQIIDRYKAETENT